MNTLNSFVYECNEKFRRNEIGPNEIEAFLLASRVWALSGQNTRSLDGPALALYWVMTVLPILKTFIDPDFDESDQDEYKRDNLILFFKYIKNKQGTEYWYLLYDQILDMGYSTWQLENFLEQGNDYAGALLERNRDHLEILVANQEPKDVFKKFKRIYSNNLFCYSIGFKHTSYKK